MSTKMMIKVVEAGVVAALDHAKDNFVAHPDRSTKEMLATTMDAFLVWRTLDSAEREALAVNLYLNHPMVAWTSVLNHKAGN